MIDNLPARRTIDGEVDFTMMYAAHDAFARQLDRIAEALHRDGTVSGGTSRRWTLFATQLQIHHTAEDEALWPALRAAVASPDELGVLDAMQAEHAALDPQLDRTAALFGAGLAADAAAAVRELAAGLARHMRHEENAALPLVDAYLGRAGWADFAGWIRARQGVSGAAVYLPWVLDGAPSDVAQNVLRALPAPVRLVYRLIWRRRYDAHVA
jgi:hypothetical protein